MLNTKETMKPLILLLFIVLTSCKSEKPDKSVYEMWNNYAASNSEFASVEMPDAWHFHMNREDANRLAELTLSGKKKAMSELYSWYEAGGLDLDEIGTKHIITDFDGKAQAIIEIIKVDTIPFNKISKDYAALDMGTIIEPLKKWKKAHWDFFANALEQSGEKPTEEMLIVCEWFKTIWPENP